MELFFVVLLLLLNFGISWWNAYVAGVNWIEAKIVGGFARVLIWCAAIQSACGFTMVFTAIAAAVAYAVGYLPDVILTFMLKLMYLVIIVPVIGTGFVITVHSWMVAWRERSVLSVGIGAWNTYAQVSNLINAIRVVPQFVGDVGETLGALFKPSEGENPLPRWAIGVAILIVLCCTLGGVLLTTEIIKRYAGTKPVAVPRPDSFQHQLAR